MSDSAGWVCANSRQAEADFQAWEHLEEHPKAVASQKAADRPCWANFHQVLGRGDSVDPLWQMGVLI